MLTRRVLLNARTFSRAMNMKTPQSPPRQINLSLGWPSPPLLPPQSLLNASKTVLTDFSISNPSLGYGPDEGYGPLRASIASWLTNFYTPKDSIAPERICITGGASQNLACLLQTFTDPIYTRHVYMVAPTYFLACRIFDDSGFAGRMKAVPEDGEGIDVDYLSRSLQESEDAAMNSGNVEPKLKPYRPWRKIYKYIFYAVPTFANPSSRIMSLNRRRQLVRLARKYDALIITDDVYDMLQWSALPEQSGLHVDRAYLPRIVDIDRYLDGGPADAFGNAVSNGSFSKIIGPGCRTGWAEGTEMMAYGVSQTGSSRSGGCPSQLVASFIHEMLSTSALARHIHQELLPAYARRYHKLMNAVRRDLLPLGVTIPQADKEIAGGYFTWCTLPEPLNASDISEKALREESLIVIDGPKFRVVGDEANKETQFDKDIRLCFSWEDEELLEEGVQRLARVIERELRVASST